MKAIGQGISGGLEKVEISTDEPVRFINLPQCENINYTLCYLTPHHNYLGAIAVQNNQQINELNNQLNNTTTQAQNLALRAFQGNN